MPPPPIEVFLTTIASQPALRQRQEYILRIFQVKKIPFTSYDLASNEDAKRRWKRKAPPNKQQLPGILVGGTFPGTYEEFEEAVEYDELDRFLRLNEEWEDDEHDAPTLPVKPVGVPGASSPRQMTNQKPSFSGKPSPSPLKEKPESKEEADAGSLLGDTSLSGVSVTDEELADLVKELGLEGDEAGKLVKGLSAGKESGERSQDVSVKRKAVGETDAGENRNREHGPADTKIETVRIESDRELAQK